MKVTHLLTCLFLCITSVVLAQDKSEALAQKVADPWLALVDKGQYAETWQQASAAFKQQLTSDKWKEALVSARTPFGKVVKRTLGSAQYTTSLPNAPAGEYVVLQYQSAFENKSSATETVFMMKDADKQWRPVGYFIK
ncbi:DUF4019 domain-containing protein [Xanthocytophaga flava]|uniref:DUF4019 domain-containing protein n=1 Tax=Xanthocytophaga flava TaxID=3048013 RepID=UPI0028D23249|nr:DUF4019 domain-containing protein [Xanthocytophaga flavus]MDJ1468234.1 DUF4019 domain-containing protein [Xanthocytophaga flavus]